MKNKLLVSVFVGAIAVFAFTSCETKSDVKDVCTDMIKSTLHETPRSLVQFDVDHDKLTVSEYEFLGGVKDNRIVYRTLSFGDGVYEPKSVDTLTYEYGEWGEHGTSYSLLITPRTGDPYTLWYEGDAFKTLDGRVFGGGAADNTARVEKWEKTLGTFLNTDWEATYRGKFTMDSIFRDSIKAIYVGPPIMFKYDTLKIFTGKMDTLAADTTCTFRYEFKHDPTTLVNAAHFYQKSVSSKYDRATKTSTVISETVKEVDGTWCFTDVSTDAKFAILLTSTTAGEKGQGLNISKYKYNVAYVEDTTTHVVDTVVTHEFLLGGLTYTRPVHP